MKADILSTCSVAERRLWMSIKDKSWVNKCEGNDESTIFPHIWIFHSSLHFFIDSRSLLFMRHIFHPRILKIFFSYRGIFYIVNFCFAVFSCPVPPSIILNITRAKKHAVTENKLWFGPKVWFKIAIFFSAISNHFFEWWNHKNVE